nr:multidrug-efflux transporter, major facilitator superfamily (MFS) [Raoultella sp. NCTC 9187]
MSSADLPVNWKRNLTVTWFGCFLTGAAFSLVMPFLPLYVEQLGVTGHGALNMWSGLVFSITFLFSAVASPFWGGLADRKGRKIMLLRSALGMAIVMALMGLAQNIWQFLLLRALLGLLGGFIPNANALIATQIPRQKSGWALGTLSTGAVSGALLGPLAGGFLADLWGLRPVFFLTASVLFICFLLTLFFIREQFVPVAKKEMLSAQRRLLLPEKPKTGAQPVRHYPDYPGGDRVDCADSNAVRAGSERRHQQYCLYQRDDRLRARRGCPDQRPASRPAGRSDRAGKNPHRGADSSPFCCLFRCHSSRLRCSWAFCVSCSAPPTGALLPAVQTLLVYNSTARSPAASSAITSRFAILATVTGPLIGASVSANYGFRAVFLVTACVVLFNAIYSTITLRSAAKQRTL